MGIKKKKQFFRVVAITLVMVFAVTTTTTFGTSITRPYISAKSGIVMDMDSQRILYSKNCHLKRDPISTTKLLTTLIAIERLDLEQKVTVNKATANTEGSSMYLKAGETVTVKDLLYGALLPSGNDAAVALAKAVSGTQKKFVVLMNEKAEELGCEDSHFSNAYGWKSSYHYSSAYDMAIIAKAAFSNSTIRQVCSTEGYRIPKTNKQKSRKIYTTNSFVAKKIYKKSGVFAGKTGTWDYNNSALVSLCSRNGKETVAVILRDSMATRYKSTNQILDYAYRRLESENNEQESI